jgi:hypothetical protein
MFVQNQEFVIHLKSQKCGQPTPSSNSSLSETVQQFISTHYPKQKFLNLAIQPLIQKNMINEHLFFNNDNDIHLIDFISFISNRFYKSSTPPPQFKTLIKHIQHEKIRFPTATIKNPLAKKIFCKF